MTKNVLIVDDSAISRLMLRTIIEMRLPELEVFEAEDAEKALKACQENSIDFITLDMNMPGRDGLAVAPELQEQCPGVKIALFTANFQERVIAQAKQQGLTFIPKPITEDKVMDYFESCLG